jgi:hypothetical protein
MAKGFPPCGVGFLYPDHCNNVIDVQPSAKTVSHTCEILLVVPGAWGCSLMCV